VLSIDDSGITKPTEFFPSSLFLRETELNPPAYVPEEMPHMHFFFLGKPDGPQLPPTVKICHKIPVKPLFRARKAYFICGYIFSDGQTLVLFRFILSTRACVPLFLLQKTVLFSPGFFRSGPDDVDFSFPDLLRRWLFSFSV